MTIQEVQNAIVEEFADCMEWEDKYAHIIALGKTLAPLPEQYRTDDNKVRGCQSQVWLHAELQDGKVVFFADADAAIVKGLVALALRVYSHREPQEILNTEPEFMKKIGLDMHLSSTRTNGFAAMIKQIKAYALGFALLQQRTAEASQE
ncbi:MAG: SufE family protein [Bacteroidota bacterium]|nr:SufE family protein [Candidatus Kapabacteria bacterium]MDW8219486.1 SufE family protein [Bacteroidota bacterium]